MDRVAETYHLTFRRGVWYYRRRVPDHLVGAIGKSVIQFSLETKVLKHAKRHREIADLGWSAKFGAAENAHPDPEPASLRRKGKRHAQLLSNERLRRLVWDHVARMDARFEERVSADPQASETEEAEIKADIEVGLGLLENRDDSRGAECVYTTGERILEPAGLTPTDLGGQGTVFDEPVRRALLEVDRRRLAHITVDHSHPSIDRLFDRRHAVHGSQDARRRDQQHRAAISCSSGFHKCVRFLSISVTTARPRLPSELPSRVASSSPPAPPPTTTMR